MLTSVSFDNCAYPFLSRFLLDKISINSTMSRYWSLEEWREGEETLCRGTHLLHEVEYTRVLVSEGQVWKADEKGVAESLI